MGKRAENESQGCKLILWTDETVNNPSPDVIRKALNEIAVSTDWAFAILERNENHFIQAATDGEGGIVLEFQDGGLHAHYACNPEVVIPEDAISVLIAYANGNEWKERFKWGRVDLA